MLSRYVLSLLCIVVFASSSLAQDDVMEKIRLLELQIQELKLLKEQQSVTEAKFNDCMKVVSRERFCTCISSNLPLEVGFEKYVHTLLTSRDKLGYTVMTVDQKKVVDATAEVREKCTEKGLFK